MVISSGFEDFEFPIETHWQGDNVGEFEKICDGARRINILHGHYTPMKAIVNNKDKIIHCIPACVGK